MTNLHAFQNEVEKRDFFLKSVTFEYSGRDTLTSFGLYSTGTFHACLKIELMCVYSVHRPSVVHELLGC